MKRALSIFAAVLFALSVAVVSAGPSVEGWGVPLTLNRTPAFQRTATTSFDVYTPNVGVGSAAFRVCDMTDCSGTPDLVVNHDGAIVAQGVRGFTALAMGGNWGNTTLGAGLAGGGATGSISFTPTAGLNVYVRTLVTANDDTMAFRAATSAGVTPFDFLQTTADITGASKTATWQNWSGNPAVTEGNGLDGYVLTATGATTQPAWEAAAGPFGGTQRLTFCYPATTAATSLTCYGFPALNLLGTGSNNRQLARNYVGYVTANSIATEWAGWAGPYTESAFDYMPAVQTHIATEASIATRRLVFGLSSATLLTTTAQAGPAALAKSALFAIYDSAAVTTNWWCCAADGVNYSCGDSGLAAAVTTDYAIILDARNPASMTCSINGTVVTRTTNLPTGATTNGVELVIATTATMAAKIISSGWTWTQNN